MIAQRFRPLGWVAGVATAATGLYLVSLQAAAERGKLDAVERQIAGAQRELRQLQTELGTRASLRQLEAWNGDVLALSAPKAAQFVRDPAQLTALNLKVSDSPDTAPSALFAAATTVVVAEPALPAATSTPAVMSNPAVKKSADPVRDAVVRTAALQPMKLRVQRVAMLDTRTVGDLGRVAAAERRTRP